MQSETSQPVTKGQIRPDSFSARDPEQWSPQHRKQKGAPGAGGGGWGWSLRFTRRESPGDGGGDGCPAV